MDEITLADMFRTAPVRNALVTAVPLLLAVGQLANSLVNDLPLVASIPFAAVLVGVTWHLTQYRLLRFRRRQLEGLPR